MMYTLSIAASLAGTPPSEVPTFDPSPAVDVPLARRVLVRPLRLATRASAREGMKGAAVFEVGIQVLRTERWAVDLDASYATTRGMDMGPQVAWRRLAQGDVTLDWVVDLGRGLAAGPVAGLSIRDLDQQGFFHVTYPMPFGGLRAQVALLRTRHLAVALDARTTLDLQRTRLVFEDASVSTMSPWEIQGGLRVQLGHGRSL